jgi:nucleotide-binding universal stress UspA family protein
MIMFKHILVPLDGSQLAETAIAAAKELAARFDSELTLLRIVTPLHPTIEMGGDAYASLLVNLRKQAFEDAEVYLKQKRNILRKQGFHVSAHITEEQPIAEAIVHIAAALAVDTIVMSTHGRGGLSRWVYGSVADKVLRSADVPVLLIRAQEEPIDWEMDVAIPEIRDEEAMRA